MTKPEREQSLINARRAREWLRNVIVSVYGERRADMECLLAEFDRLDAKEQAQIKAGKRYGKLGAEHGHKGGRPKKTKQATEE